METISIIIPAYNAQKTIERCVNSILRQTFQDFTIYIIDDCSTDNTWDIISEKYNNNSKIKIFRNPNNLGPSGSRNRAIDLCSGIWLCFIDSDDYIMPDYLGLLISNSHKANIVIGSFRQVDSSDNLIKEYIVSKEYVSLLPETALLKAYGGPNDLDFIYNLCCNKIYKRDLFNDVRFPEGRLQEDAFVMPFLIYNSKGKVNIAPDAFYHYVNNCDSVSHKGQIGEADMNRRLDLVYLYDNHIKLYKKEKNELYKRSRANLLNNIISIYQLHHQRIPYKKHEFNALFKQFRQHYLAALFEGNPNLTKPLLCTWLIFAISPRIYLRLF